MSHLDEVGEIEHGLEVGAIELVHQVLAAGGVVAVDALLVFVEEDAVPGPGGLYHLSHAVQDFPTVEGGVLALGQVEAEHAEIGGAELLLDLQGALELFQVGAKSSVTLIFPMGEPMEDTATPASSSLCLTSLTLAGLKSETLTPSAARSSMWVRPHSVTAASWVSNSGAISSEKTGEEYSIHISRCPPWRK